MRCCAGSLPSPSPQWTPVAPPCRAATQHRRGSQPFKGRRLSRAGPGWGQQICVPSSSHTPLPSRSRAAGILSVGSSATARRLSARWHGPSVRTQGPQVEWGRGAAGKTAGASLLKQVQVKHCLHPTKEYKFKSLGEWVTCPCVPWL